jgi:hypothetical protein
MIPPQFWLGVSIESDRYAKRADFLRRLKDRHGLETAFISFGPLIGSVTATDLTGIDWIIIEGESGGDPARYAHESWVYDLIDKAHKADVPVWFKQWGEWPANPQYRALTSMAHDDRLRILAYEGRELAFDDHGGATLHLNGEYRILHDLPRVYDRLTDQIQGVVRAQEGYRMPTAKIPTVDEMKAILGQHDTFDAGDADEIVQTAFAKHIKARTWRPSESLKQAYIGNLLAALEGLEQEGSFRQSDEGIYRRV